MFKWRRRLFATVGLSTGTYFGVSRYCGNLSEVLEQLLFLPNLHRDYLNIDSFVFAGLSVFQAEREEMGRITTSLVLKIAHDGIVLYYGEGTVSSLLKEVKDAAKKAELVRYKATDGKYGWSCLSGRHHYAQIGYNWQGLQGKTPPLGKQAQ